MKQQIDHIPDVRKKVTAVEWLIDKVEDHFCLLPLDLIEQAKEMEKDQIMNSWAHGVAEPSDSQKTAEQYYNETYGK